MRRLWTLIKKESLQIIRDPSSVLIALLLPLLLLFIFGYGVNLDNNRVRVGVVLEEINPDVVSLANAFTQSPFFAVTTGRHRQLFEQRLVSGELRGIIIIPQGFSARALSEGRRGALQVIADGSEPNIASFVQNYTRGVLNVWLAHESADRGVSDDQAGIIVASRFWYNPELKSRNFLLPGSIAIVMTLIGTLLTALVIAREWERGTMEALMATPVTILQILLGKLIPYFVLGIGSMALCWLVAVFWYEVPFRGSFAALAAATAVFLFGALGQGLLISTAAKDQFIASQAAMMSGFLPAFMLSGFIFEISSMPEPIQWLTYVFSARYFVTSLQTLFLAGNVWPLLLYCMSCMALIGTVFFALTAVRTRKRLDR